MKKSILEKNVNAEIIRLCHSTLDSRTLRAEVLKSLRKVIPFDYIFFSTTDPSTQFFTSAVTDETPTWALLQFLENEFLHDDVNQFRTLLKNRQSVAVLSEQTEHELHRSQRYRDILVPLALGDEMRAVFVTNAGCWGTLCLHREQGAPEYTTAEARFLAQLTPHIADGLRKALLLSNTSTATPPGGPGILVMSEDYSVVSMNATAAYWMAELAEAERGNKQALPHTVMTVVTRLRVIERGLSGSSPLTPKLNTHTPSGHWLTLYASRMSNPSSSGLIAILFELAQPAEIAPLLLQAYHLTRREGEVTYLVLHGQSTRDIAATMQISVNTVQDHLKAIFEKVNVSSRRELSASIFAQHYLPLFLTPDAALDSAGRLTTLESPTDTISSF
jgi:DNA-binding CsgD family transcriptional regulator